MEDNSLPATPEGPGPTAVGGYAGELEAATRGLLDVNVRAVARMQQEIGLEQLRALQALERRGGTSTVGEFAAELGELGSTASRLSDRLSDAGLIVRKPSPTDRRSTLLELTATGQALLDELIALRTQALDVVTRHLDEPTRTALLDSARAFTHALAHIDHTSIDIIAPVTGR